MTTPSRPGPSPEPARETAEPKRPGGWRPWHGRPRARDVLCALAIVVSGVYAIGAIPLTPALIASHPVLLERRGRHPSFPMRPLRSRLSAVALARSASALRGGAQARLPARLRQTEQ